MSTTKESTSQKKKGDQKNGKIKQTRKYENEPKNVRGSCKKSRRTILWKRITIHEIPNQKRVRINLRWGDKVCQKKETKINEEPIKEEKTETKVETKEGYEIVKSIEEYGIIK